jgi:hypothetical protein
MGELWTLIEHTIQTCHHDSLAWHRPLSLVNTTGKALAVDPDDRASVWSVRSRNLDEVQQSDSRN